nr:MAG TPA: hypothetical protein [Caudoviricetes sp.]DAQ70291.1 MAG TPA: hypothetical protein [Caudoviricetes sp.]
MSLIISAALIFCSLFLFAGFSIPQTYLYVKRKFTFYVYINILYSVNTEYSSIRTLIILHENVYTLYF